MRHKKGQMRGKELNTSFSLFCSLDKGFAESIFSWVAFIEGDRRRSQPPSENLRLPVF